MSTDWLPSREQNFTDLCNKWKIGLSEAGNIAAFGWNEEHPLQAMGFFVGVEIYFTGGGHTKFADVA